MKELVSASFTSKGKFFKALVDASKVVDTNFIEFTRNAVKIVSADPSRYIMLNARVTPPDYRCDADSVWVEATELDAIAKKLKPKDNYKVEIRDSEFYVGHFKVGKVVNVEDVSQVEADRDALANLEKSDSAGFLKVVFPGFRRIVKDAEKTKIPDSFRDKYEYVGFKIEDRKGAIVFYYDKDHFGAPIDFQTYPEWLVDSGGKAEAVYKLDLFSSMMRLGLGDLVTLDIRTGKLLRVNYFGDYWNIDFWVGSYGVEESVEDLEAILTKPTPKRNLAWSTEGTVLKDFVKVMKAIASVVYGNVNIGISGDDLLVYWQNGATCLFRMPYRHFEEFDREQHFIGQIDISELTGFLRSVENLKCYVEGEPAESLVFVGSGKNIAEKEYKSEELVKTVKVPDVGGTLVFSGETKMIQNMFEDALLAEDEFLVFIASGFEITVIGRNNVYYTATLPLDGFQIQSEDYVATTYLDGLRTFFSQVPAAKVAIGKDENNVTVEAETTLGPIKIMVFQVLEDLLPAIQVYEDFLKAPTAPSPEVKPLPEQPAASIKAYWKPSPRGITAFWVEVYVDGNLRIRGHREVRRETEETLKRSIEEKLQGAVTEAGLAEDALAAERLELIGTLLESVPADVAPITLLTQEEFYKRFDDAMDEWLPYAIEQHKSGLAGNLHYDAPQYEAETLAKFTPQGVKEKYGKDIEQQREGSWQYYSESAPVVAARYLKSVSDVARALAYSWTVKLSRQLLSEATEKAKAAVPEEKARAIVMDEIKKEIKKSHMEPQAVYSLIRVYVKDKGVDESTLRKILEDLKSAGEIIEYAPGLYKLPSEEKAAPPLTAYSVEGAVYYKSFETEENAFKFRDEKQTAYPSENYVVVKPELPIDMTKPYEVWLMQTGAKVPASILVKPKKAPPPTVKPEPKFSVGQQVIYQGETFTVLKREFDQVWRYKLRDQPQWLMPPESEITAAPSKEIKEVVEEEPIPEEPEQTVYVKVHVEGGVEADQKGKPKIATPEFVIMCTTYEVFAEHGNTWKADMWSRPLTGMYGVKLLDDVMKDGEIEYDAVEDNQMTWGDDWASIREALSQNPPPFNKYAKFIVKWRPEDVTWTETARQAYDIYKHKYTREELSRLRKKQLQIIAKIKDLSTSGDEPTLIGNIVAAGAYAEEIGIQAVEEKAEEKPSCAGGACLLPGSYERFNLAVPPTHDELLEIGLKRPIVAVYRCLDKSTNTVRSEQYYCDICAAELEEGVYPGGTVFPSMYPVREYDNTICRRLWLSGGEEKVKALQARLTKPTPEGYMILGKRAIEMADQAIEEFGMRFKGLEGKVHVDYGQLFQHWDVVPPEKKAALKRIITVALEIAQERPKEATNIYFFNWLKSSESLQKIALQLGFDSAYWEKIEEAKAPVKSEAEKLAEEALKEMAGEALGELEGL